MQPEPKPTRSTVPRLVADASAAGLVTRREVLDGMVTVRSAPPGSSQLGAADASGQVHAILVRDQAVAVVKEPARGSAAERAVDRERLALSTVGAVDLGPRLLSAQPGRGLWVRPVRGHDLTWPQGTVPELAEVCERWGMSLAQLHQLAAPTDAPDAPRPWLLDPVRRDRAAARAGRGSAHADVLAVLEREPELRLAAQQVEDRWTQRHWMHGDLCPANVVVHDAAPVRVAFLDFAQAGLGDPAWDVASCLDALVWVAARASAPADCLADYFLRGYRRAGGPGTLYPAMQALRALCTAAQHPQWGPEPYAGLPRWLDRARSFAERAARQPRVAA